MEENNFNNGDQPRRYGYGNYYQNDEGLGDQKIDLKNILRAFKQHKKFIVGSILACMAIAFFYSYLVPPIYQGTGSIMIRESQQGKSSDNNELADLLDKTYGVGANNTVANELQFLRSRQISLNMATDILDNPRMDNGSIYPILWKNYPKDSSIASRDTVVHRIRKKITFAQKSPDADLVQIAFESPSRQEAVQMVNLAMDTYASTSTKINQKTANSAVKFLNKERTRLKSKLQNSEQELRSFMKKSDVVEVDAQTKEHITNMSKLESERQSAKANLVAVKSAIKDYKNQLDKIKPGLSKAYSEASGPQLDRYQYQLAELETQKTLYQSKNPWLKNAKNPPDAYTQVINKIAFMKDKIQKLTDQVTTKKDQYLGMLSSNSSDGLPADVNRLNQKLVELQAEKSQYQAKVKVLGEQVGKQRTFFRNLPDNKIDLARMQRDRDINSQMYRNVSDQYNEMVLWQKTHYGLGQVVDKAFAPKVPVKPNRKLYLLISFFVGCIFSIGYLTIRDLFGSTIDSVHKLKEREYPLLGVIPMLQKATRKKLPSHNVSLGDKKISPTLISVLDPISPGAEAFRRMNFNIFYSNSDSDEANNKTILITSSVKGEGKTTTISNLAAVLAEARKKVIIVDTDLGQPNVHNLFGINRSPGLVDVIRGEVVLKDAINSLPYANNVDILTSGSLSTNPAAINQDPKFKFLLQNLQMQYDYVLVDTAPYGIVTDAAPIMKLVDGVVMVARFRKTEEVDLDHTMEYLHKIQANILGFAITAFDPSKGTDYQYNSSYYRSAYKDYYSHNKNIMSS